MDNNKNVQLHVFGHTDLSTHDIQLWGAAIPLLLSITPIQALLLEEPSVFPFPSSEGAFKAIGTAGGF